MTNSHNVKLIKMKKPFIITVLLLLLTFIVKAQESLKTHQAQPDSVIRLIPVDVGNHVATVYTIGGKIVTSEDVKARILAYAPSAGEYHRAKTSLTWGIVTTGGFAASMVGAVIEFATHNKHAGETTGFVNGEPEFIYQHHSLAGAYILTGAASAFLITSIINYIHAARHAHKSLYLYNQQYQ